MFSGAVLTKSKSGKIELRALQDRGRYVLYKYLNPQTLKPADKKKKLCLKSEDGEEQSYFIIPLKGNRSLLVESGEEKERKIWNEKRKKEERLW